MRRLIPFLLFVACMSVGVQDAFAGEGVWGWLEQFSGPGSFTNSFFGKGTGTFVAPNACITGDNRGIKVAGSDTGPALRTGTPDDNAVCLWLDVKRNLTSPANSIYGEVKASVYDWGVSASLQRAVSVGFGFGRLNFATAGLSGTGEFKTSRWIVTPIRITVIPASVITAALNTPIPSRTWANIANVPQLYGKIVCVSGDLATADFGGLAGHPYKSHNECVNSWGLQFNLLELTK